MNSSLIADNTEIESWAAKYYGMSIRQGAVYWGTGVCNSINPLTLAFSDFKNDPNMLFTRFIIYCNAQAFAPFLYLIYPDPTTRLIIDFMLSPLILFF